MVAFIAHRWLPTLAAIVAVAGLPAEAVSTTKRRRAAAAACSRRLLLTDFNAEQFKSPWTNQANMSAFSECLYALRTTLRPPHKSVLVGGVHYPTLIVANHQTPPVSSAAARWCWLDGLARNPSGLTAGVCCNLAEGPKGMEACWSDHFTYELCCLGDVGTAELPHYFVGPAYDLNVANAVRQVGTFDLGQSYAMQTLCKEGDVVLDIGANVGGFTVPLAERVGPTGEVHAFEPFRKVFQHLNANVALNGLGNVFTYNTALGQEDKVLEVFTPDLNTFNFPSAMKVEEQYVGRDAEGQNLRYEKLKERISVRRLDDVDFFGKTVRFVKIDVEFMELGVILGGKEFFRHHRPVIWAENEPFFDDPPDRRFVDTMFNELDYDCQVVARLELICTPARSGEPASLPPGFQRVMRHLSGRSRDISLWRALSEVQPVEVEA